MDSMREVYLTDLILSSSSITIAATLCLKKGEDCISYHSAALKNIEMLRIAFETNKEALEKLLTFYKNAGILSEEVVTPILKTHW